MYKAFVDKIHQEKAKNDSNSRDLARTLNVLSKTVFGEVNRFVFELLQNADDSSANGATVNVQFRLLDNYLIFSHNGKHFTSEDVQGISGIGNRASQKDKNNEKTGYKGIGFKSVFGSSDYAHILSGGFSFRFDKNYVGFDGSEDYPWQVVPIWTNEPADEVNGKYSPEHVNTIIKVGNREIIRQEIVNVFEDCQIILFLRNVEKVTFIDRGNKIFEVSKKVNSGVVDLYNNEELESSWLLQNMELPINEELSIKLNQLSETECPQKLKEAKATKLTFAAMIEGQHLIPIKQSVIYSYLPTKAKKGFLFLINGDFLTNAERTELMPNIWNEFLFTEIARRQLEWFRDLQKTIYRYDVLKLLNGKYPSYSTSKIELAYNKSLANGALTVDFLPEQANDEYTITIANSIIDGPKFSEMFSPSIIADFLGISETHGVADIRLESQSGLIELGAKQFTFTSLLNLISSGKIADVNGAINVVVFFYNKTLNNKNPSWLVQLQQSAFIMDESGVYKTPKEIFIPIQDEMLDIEFGDLTYVHMDILTHFSGNTDVLNWLQCLGVREPTEIEIVRKALIPIILNNGINECNALSITRFIIKVYRAKLLNDQDYEDLKLLKLITSNGLKSPSQCYLSDAYNPEKKLSSILPNANFLSASYIEIAEDSTEWKFFFKKIGVRESITIDFIEEKIERQTFEKLYPEAKKYFTWLEDITAYPSIYHSYRYSGQHYIQNFTALEFRSHLNEIDFSKFFWGKMIDSWEVFKQKCSTTRYYYRGGSDIVPSYVQYYVRNFPCIPCTDGNCYNSENVFSPSLKSIIGTLLPVADLSTSMTIEQADFFGFRRVITVLECMALLDKLSMQVPSSDLNKQVFSIYNQLNNQSSSKDALIQTEIALWRKKGNVLTIKNTFKPIKDLYTFSVHGIAVPVNSERFIKLPSAWSFDEMKAFSDLLSIPVITFDLLEFVPQSVEKEESLRVALIKRVRFLALIHSHNSNENYTQVVMRLNAILKATQFFQGEELNLIYKLDNGDLIFNSKIDAWSGEKFKFYFTGKWRSPLTLYGLSNSICALLDLKHMEREFGLILQLAEDEIFHWLVDKGYEVNHLLDEELLFDMNDNLHDIQEIEPAYYEESPYTGLDVEIFVEKVKVADIDYATIVPIVKEFTNVSIATEKTYVSIENEQVRIDIGRWSENYVFNYLTNNPQLYSSIIWLNEFEESYSPYDFEVIENGTQRIIEVKGTPSLSKEILFLSSAEWKILFEHEDKYSIFRVFGAGTTTNRLERTDNLQELISEGKLLSFPIELSLP